MLRANTTVAFFAVTLALSPSARAQVDEGAPRSAAREVPDYDGRGGPPEDPAEPWMWIPRVVTGPLYLVSEYLLRAPLGWLLTELERSGALGAIASYLAQDFVVLPLPALDLGALPSLRVIAFWRHALHDDNRIDVSGAVGGSGALDLGVADTVSVDDIRLRAHFRALRREDRVFAGVGPGPDNTAANRARFTEERIEAGLRFDWDYWRRSRLRVAAAYDSRSFADSDALGDPPLSARQDRLAGGRLPAAFEEGYSAFRARLELVVDTREATDALTGGARLGAYVEPGVDVERPSERGWVRWGAHAMVATDALGAQRVLGLEGDVHAVEATGSSNGELPFTELIDPGALGVLPAYLPGQLRGLSSASLTVRYRWPIWVFLDGSLFCSIGSVFGARLRDFALDDLRYSFGIGVDARDGGEHPFVFQLAFGSETFANGGEITSFRLLLGARSAL